MLLRANLRHWSGRTRRLTANPRRSDSVRRGSCCAMSEDAGLTPNVPSQVPALYLPCSGCTSGARAGRRTSGQIELAKRSNTARRSPGSLPQLSKELMVSFTEAHDTMDSRDLVRFTQHPERGPYPGSGASPAAGRRFLGPSSSVVLLSRVSSSRGTNSVRDST
jgi:hypothetical protein